MNTNYLDSAKKQFEYYKILGDKTIAQLSDDKLFWQYNDDSNSIAIIVKHLSGNMLSRWTDFLTSDGEKEWRNRDNEFENDIKTKDELIQKWNKGWNCLFNALNTLKDKDLSKIIYIRNEGHTILEAINRQLAHYPYHVGQMVFIGKMMCKEKWISLSIPKGKSDSYNTEKFAKEKRKQHFTDELIKNINMKNELIKDLKEVHSTLWTEALKSPNPLISVNEKWSVYQNIDHINIGLLRVGNFLSLSKSSIENQYGLSNKKPLQFEDFMQEISKVFSKKIIASAPFIPSSEPDGTIEELIEQGKKILDSLITSLDNWSEIELDSYNCPHPVLGKISVREILYFTIYHASHHKEKIEIK